jgi:pimeloyl-ACP methyl ester carboxylesterase
MDRASTLFLNATSGGQMPYATNGDVRIHYHLEGLADGPPLVVQHGYSMSLYDWYDPGYVNTLGKTFRLILIDARGHGASGKPHDPNAYRAAHMASDVVAVLDDLGIAQAHFFGYSMGGRIGFALARDAASRLHSLVLGGNGANDRSPDEPVLKAYLERLRQGPEVLTDTIRAVFGSWATSEMLERQVGNDLDALTAYQSLEERPRYAEDLRDLTVPCLVYCGDADPDYADARAIAAAIPNAQFLPFPGLDHMATLYRTDVVLPHITAFLADAACSPR